ncbi:Chaperone protein DnaJ [Streptococcus sp. DD10]|uniref:J domain-containing protein n=1 Tax=Streptococcus sp. DD10 TaxID=1777878 RepID=UPI000793F096|nr:DnaJ domain-containing protein [Streptococcus sp. DD10]KXT75187.1 Chaperone protein DnaJ [Streptococcus sp. DD10]
MSESYYDMLQVPENASFDQIKSAYRRLVKEYHPDKNPQAGAAERFQQIKEAYDTLSDYQARREYDDWYHVQEAPTYQEVEEFQAKPVTNHSYKQKRSLLDRINFELVWTIIKKVVATPIIFVLFCIDFVKVFLGMVLMWVIGKICVGIVLLLVLAGLIDGLHILNESFGDGVLRWFGLHVMGFAQSSFVDGVTQTFSAPSGAINFFAYPAVEFSVILVVTIVLAGYLARSRFEMV